MQVKLEFTAVSTRLPIYVVVGRLWMTRTGSPRHDGAPRCLSRSVLDSESCGEGRSAQRAKLNGAITTATSISLLNSHGPCFTRIHFLSSPAQQPLLANTLANTLAMTSQSRATYAARGQKHAHPVARHLFEIAELKQSNLVVSADLYDSKSLLELADSASPSLA